MEVTSRHNQGFTLTEILVVLGIIVILTSISFPVFRRVQENANQAACIVKLQQIGIAVKQYKMDYHIYPSSLNEIEEYLQVRSSGGKASHGKDMLICPDDESIREDAFTNSSFPYSSYYDVNGTSLVWNYYGLKYKKTDATFYGDTELGYAYGLGTDTNSNRQNDEFETVMSNAGVTNPKHYTCLANRFAPEYTIVTHCVHHRGKSASDNKQQMDIAVRLDGGWDKPFWYTYNWNTQPD